MIIMDKKEYVMEKLAGIFAVKFQEFISRPEQGLTEKEKQKLKMQKLLKQKAIEAYN